MNLVRADPPPFKRARLDALVRIRPTYYTHRIVGAINEVLTELSSPMRGIYSVGTVDLTYEPTIDLYDLTAAENLQSVLEVQMGDPDDPTSDWSTLSSTRDRMRIQPSKVAGRIL